jgi:hypothetical protein
MIADLITSIYNIWENEKFYKNPIKNLNYELKLFGQK